jgi:SAM-dependent methyltransferase
VRLHAVTWSADAGLSVTSGYDAIAAGYEAQVAGDAWMRRALHSHFARVFAPGKRILDVGCGTGLDAIALAQRGLRVVAVDGSSRMIAHLQANARAAGVADRVEAHVLRIEALDTLNTPDAQPFDGLISAFGSLSALPDLTGFANDAAGLVRPGGRVVLHLLNRFSTWEWLGYVRQRNWTAAARVGREQTRLFTIGGQAAPHSLYFADEAYRRFFEPQFVRHAAYGFGAIRPPHTVRRVPPRVTSMLERLDVRSGSWPLVRDGGRFFVLDLERRAT